MLSRIVQLGMKKAHISIESILEGPGTSSPDPRFHLSNSLKTLMNLNSIPLPPKALPCFDFGVLSFRPSILFTLSKADVPSLEFLNHPPARNQDYYSILITHINLNSLTTAEITANMSTEASHNTAPKITIVRDLQNRQLAYIDTTVGLAAAVEKIGPSFQ